MNTAARLADAAAVGAVYAGETTAGATRHLASWRHLRPMRLKGKRAPVETYELLGLLDAPGTRGGLGDEAPFVGRETELALSQTAMLSPASSEALTSPMTWIVEVRSAVFSDSVALSK